MLTPDTLFNIWEESVTDGPGTQTAVVVGAFPTEGYVLGRRDPSADRFYFGLDSDSDTTQQPAFVPEGWTQTYVSRPYAHYLDDAAIGDVAYTFTRGADEVHFVTVKAADPVATVLVFKHGAESPGKYTVDVGSADASLCTFAWSKGQQKLEYISEGVDSPYNVMLSSSVMVQAFQITATVGRATPPAWEGMWRYEEVSGVTVFPVTTQPALASTVSNISRSVHPVYVGLPNEVRNNNGDIDLIEHQVRPYWQYSDYGDSSSHWTHLFRATYKTGVDGLGDVYVFTHQAVVGRTLTGGFNTLTYQTPPVLDEGEMFAVPNEYMHVEGPLYVKFGDTAWEFGWLGGETGDTWDETTFTTGTNVLYPDELQRVVESTTYNYTMDEVLAPGSFSVGRDALVGPLVKATYGPATFLFVLQPKSPHGDLDDFWYTSQWNTLMPWNTEEPDVYAGAVCLTYEQVGDTYPHPLLTFATTSKIASHVTSPVATANDLDRAPRVIAAVSWEVEDPIGADSSDNLSVFATAVENQESITETLEFEMGSVQPSLSATLYEPSDSNVNVPIDPGPVVFDVVVDVAAWWEFENITLSVDDQVVLSASVTGGDWLEFVDVSVGADHDFDAAVEVESWTEFADLTLSSDPHLVFTVFVSGTDWYTVEDITVEVLTETAWDATVSVSDPVVVDNLTVLPMTEFDASVLVVSVGESTGEPPPPGTCLSGEFTVTLPAGADPEIPLTYVVDGRLVQVWHDGVVLDTFYLLTSDLADFCVNVVSSSGDPLPELPNPDVQYETPTYMGDTSMQEIDTFMWGEGDFSGAVWRGPSILIDNDDNVEIVWNVSSPDDLTGMRVVWLFGYENPPIDFHDAALIAESGNGKYLRAVLPAL